MQKKKYTSPLCRFIALHAEQLIAQSLEDAASEVDQKTQALDPAFAWEYAEED